MPKEDLLSALRSQNQAAVASALADGTSADTLDEHGASALVLAARVGHTGILRLLLGRGADVELRGKADMTALHWAAVLGHSEAVAVLLDAGATVGELTGVTAATPLILAAAGGHLEVVRLLCGRGADLDYRDQEGWTAWTVAWEKGRTEVLRFLEESGAEQVMPPGDEDAG
jgi:ankyrin repeat protein